MSLFSNPRINIPQGGCVPSKPDKRDVLMSEVYPLPVRIAPELPPPFDLDILNQGQTPHCVGYSSAAIKQEKELRERINKVFDGDWIYQKCKEIDEWNGQGTYLRIGLKILQKLGAKPKDEPESEAIKYRIGGYALADNLTFEGLKKAIYVNGILLAGFTGSNQGWQNQWIRPPKLFETKWGHAVALIGYNKDYIIGQNSWGKNWGDNGLFYIPKTYMPFESWAILTDYPTSFLTTPIGIEGWVVANWTKLVLDEGSILHTIANLNFREQPTTDSKVIKTLNIDEKLVYSGEKKVAGNYTWLKVKV